MTETGLLSHGLVLAMAAPADGNASPWVQLIPFALVLAGEMTGAILNTVHNLRFYLDTMARIREAISFGSLGNLQQSLRVTFSRQLCDS
jgi:queuine/archaeosine tRNA-ribosyltransferase